MSGYILDYYGYGFNGIGSLEEYFAYDPDEYYASLQMGLPALYDSGRENPPHPEIWVHYFLKIEAALTHIRHILWKKGANAKLTSALRPPFIQQPETQSVLQTLSPIPNWHPETGSALWPSLWRDTAPCRWLFFFLHRNRR